MNFPRSVGAGLALWLAAVASCFAQTETRNLLNEKIQQADRLQAKGALQEARKLYESILKSLPAGELTPQLGHVLNALSGVASAEGNYEPAIEFAQQAADVFHKLGDPGQEANSLNYRGIAEVQRGLYPKAQLTLSQALQLSRSAGDLESEVRILNNLGTAHYLPGQYLEALRAYGDAGQIVNRSASEKWSDYWRQITQINEATLYQRLGRYQNALQIYQQVETTSKALTASDRAHLLTNLGVLYRRLGDPWKALASYRSALALYSRQHDSDGEISVLKNIGIVYALDQHDLGKAEQFFNRALARAAGTHNQREEMQGHLYLGETQSRKGAAQAGLVEFQQALAQAKQLGTTEEEWKALYGMGRTEELLGDLKNAEADYRRSITTIETTRTQLQISALRAEFLADKRDAYDALIAVLLRKKDIKESFAFLERSRARTFQDRLASAASGRETSPAALNLDEVRTQLDDSTILLEFWTSGDRLAVIWCTRASYGMEQKQFSAAEREAVLLFLRGLPDNLRGNWRQQVAILSRLIPDGLSLPPTMRHVLIVPDGWLSSVPFDLVPVAENSGTLLIERFDISYLPTAAILRRAPATKTGLRFPWMRELVAFGNPTIQERSAMPGGLENSGGLQALPYSGEEIRSISNMARGRAALFLGSADVKSAFLTDNAHSAAILHVSTHAFADADTPEDSRILFSPETMNGTADYVFLRELYDMDLRGVDLATLSACNTERGKMIRGEGVQAFSRALLFAGSRSALTTLWRVNDQPTSEFMKQFYYYALQKRQPKAEALRSAKLKFLHSRTELENPAHWAAFVLHGDGIGALPNFVSWGALAAVTAGVATLALVLGLCLSLGVRRRVHGIDRS